MYKNNTILLGIGAAILLSVGIFFMIPYFEYISFAHQYAQEKYDDILGTYSGAENLSSPELHNLGNTYFMQYMVSGEQDNLYSALDAYSGSLKLQQHKDTRYNYEYVKSLLAQEQASQSQEKNQKQNSDSEKNNSSDAENPQSKEGENLDQESGEKNTQTNKDRSQNQTGEQGEENSEIQAEQKQLTPEQKKQLEHAAENLKKEQMYNQQYFGKQSQQSDFFGSFESFFGEIDRGQKKNW